MAISFVLINIIVMVFFIYYTIIDKNPIWHAFGSWIYAMAMIIVIPELRFVTLVVWLVLSFLLFVLITWYINHLRNKHGIDQK